MKEHTEQSYTTLGYIAERMHKRIADGERAGQAVMNVIATIDPAFYSHLLDKEMDMFYTEVAGLDGFWEYVLTYYDNPKIWSKMDKEESR